MPHNWHQRYIELARHVATWSKDPSTQVGAVIVDQKRRVVSMGYNGFPRGVLDFDELYQNRFEKLKFICHAERNALDNSPHSVEQCSLYATFMPCNECAKSIIQRGITAVYTIEPIEERNDTLFSNMENNSSRYNWNYTLKMFDEADVKLHYVE